MNKIKYILFLLMIFFVFTQGMWERLFFLSPMIQYVVDGTIIAFILFQFKYHKNVPGSGLFFILLISAFFIGSVNNDSLFETFLFLRYIIFTYLIYNQLFYLNISQQQWGSIYKFIIALSLLQGIGALYNIFILGERVEGYVGLMSSLGGTTATIFPLIISSLIFVYYLFCPRLNKMEIVLLLTVLFSSFLVGYASGKRSIYFIIPIMFALITIISLPKIIRKSYFKRKFSGVALFSVLIFPLIIFGIVNSLGLNYSLSGSESSIEVITSSLDYANEYESAVDQYGRTIGRSNTTIRIVDNALNDRSLFFAGAGYGTTKEESSMLKLGYGYGIVGFTRDLISGGFFLSLLTILLFYKIFMKSKSQKSNFSRTLRMTILGVFIYTYFFYSADFNVSLKITLIIVIVLSLINSPKHAEVFHSFTSRKNIT